MGSLVEESLFSLELVVDKLTMPNIPCRFPAIAFRLLDFPTLVIYHVEPDLGNVIKFKVKSDPYYKLGTQIPELLDKNGSYSVRKGKSCLLKISPDMLLSHLASTPLYVMILDTFPEVPKLIGNCTVPLDSTMEGLYDDICKQGLAVPVVNGEKGVYKIYNLMGIQIGGLVLGIRLLSLGVGLIPHLPTASIASLPKQKNASKTSSNSQIQTQVADMILEDLENKKNMPTCEFVKKPTVTNIRKGFQMQTQTEEEIVQNMATQTEKRKSKIRIRHQKQDFETILGLQHNMIDDIIVTNTVCPPPLFFNSKNDTENSKGLEIFEHLMDKQPEDILESESGFSDSDTIREEDWASDTDISEDRQYCNDVAVNSVQVVKRNKLFSDNSNEKKSTTLKGFPILNALMSEINSLQNRQPDRMHSSQIHIHTPGPSGPKFLQSPLTGFIDLSYVGVFGMY